MDNKLQFISLIKTPPITTSHKILKYLVFLTILLTLTFLIFSGVNFSKARKNISSRRIEEVAAKVKSEFNDFSLL